MGKTWAEDWDEFRVCKEAFDAAIPTLEDRIKGIEDKVHELEKVVIKKGDERHLALGFSVIDESLSDADAVSPRERDMTGWAKEQYCSCCGRKL